MSTALPLPSACASVESPCVRLCKVGAGRRACEGCFRTLDEIAAWGRANDAERRAILAAVAARRGG